MKRNDSFVCKLVLLILAVVVFSVACNKVIDDDTANKEEINVYFINQVDGKLVAEKIFLDPKEINTDEKKLKLAVDSIKKGPQATSLTSVIPKGVTVRYANLDGDGAKINISKQYKDLTVREQMILRASFVRTLTGFPFINWVEILVDNEPLQSTEGENVGPIFKDDIVLVQPDPKPATNVQNIVLYFGDQQGEYLVAENRKIQISSNVPLERYIMEELIKGPQNTNNAYTVPPETKINDIKTKDGVCQIDLSAEFKSKHQGGTTGELFTIYSIVNSITESSPSIKKVAFLMDGKKQTEFKGHLDLSIFFERDESLIEKQAE